MAKQRGSVGPTLMLGFCVLAAAACEDLSYKGIGGEIAILTKRNDPLVPPAIKRLAAFGRKALPQIETALHTAPLEGRLHLISALEKIGDPEAVPILRHHAVFDMKPEARKACEDLLSKWAAAKDARSETSRVALARVAAKRSGGEGPTPLPD